MSKNKKSNLAKGVNSFDANLAGTLVNFFNRNVSPYPTEAGGPAFDLVPVKNQKDIMTNASRLYAEQEYNRIMELVHVLERQAADIKRRLDITDMVSNAHYNFRLYHGQSYWLVYDKRKNFTRLVDLGPNDWSSTAPQDWQYIARLKWLGDHSWIEVEGD